jgi:hypothetical protein
VVTAHLAFFSSCVRTLATPAFLHVAKWSPEPEINFRGVVGTFCTLYIFPVAILGPSTFHTPVVTDFFHCRFSHFSTEVVISVDID